VIRIPFPPNFSLILPDPHSLAPLFFSFLLTPSSLIFLHRFQLLNIWFAPFDELFGVKKSIARDVSWLFFPPQDEFPFSFNGSYETERFFILLSFFPFSLSLAVSPPQRGRTALSVFPRPLSDCRDSKFPVLRNMSLYLK